MKKYFYSLLIVALLIPLVALAKPKAKPAPKPAAPTSLIVPEEEAVIKAYQSTLPSVVSILVSEKQKNLVGGTSQQDTGGGTGFIVSASGYIITNKHVVQRENVDYTVITSDGKEYAGSVLARDPLYDIAFIKIEASALRPLPFGDSDKLRIGQTALAIGNVLAEFKNTLTRGIVSGVGRTITASGAGLTETLEGVIQTDASINPGNSGGPLINLQGQVIGMNTAINRSGESLGFAIPINTIKQTFNNFLVHQKIVRTYLGVRYVMLNRSVARAYNLPVTAGAYIMIKNAEGDPGVVPGSPAEASGLKGGDVILEINGKKLNSTNPLASMINKFEPNQQISIKILREGTEKLLTATVIERPN